MRNRLSFLFICFFIYSTVRVYAQSALPSVEGWRVHASFYYFKDVCEAGDKIFVASTNALFSYDKSTNEQEIISRVNGLSDVAAVQLEYDAASATLIIAYDNANIDLVRNNKVTNIPEILNQIIIGDKTINNITIHDRKAYLACSFGIAVIDLVKQKMIDSYANLGPDGTNLPVYDIAFYNSKIFASSSAGIYEAQAEQVNLSDYNSWSLNKASVLSNWLETFQGILYGVVDSTLMRYDGTNWVTFQSHTPSVIYDIKNVNQKLVVSQGFNTYIYDKDTQVKVVTIGSESGALIATDEKLYIPVNGQSLYKINMSDLSREYYSPSGPQENSALRMVYKNKNLWVAGGKVNGYGTSSGWNSPQYSSGKFYRFQNNSWFRYNHLSSPVISGPGDFVDVCIDPETDHAFLANFGTGLVEMDETQVIANYDDNNSSLQRFNSGIPSYTPLLVSGVAFDEDGNLWVSNAGAVNPISVKTRDNQWHSYGVPSGVDNRLTHLTCDEYGNKWFINSRSQGILVFNDNHTLTNTGDDQYKALSEIKLNGFLPSNTVFCITRDKEGTLWTGTLKGLCIFNNPGNVFRPDANFDAEQIVIKTGLVYSNFLGDVPVYCIAVDPGNRKWIGTAQGAWLVSPDGYTIIRNFTTANSPLQSNAVYSIGIDESTGEVFFGTERGICSYMGTASEPNESQNKVMVYPNPVKPEYTGLIAIRGLLDGAYVKITDIGGNLIAETKANGGMATWNGNSQYGKRAPTGVYLIYSTNEKGEQTWVGKILLIN